MVCDLYLCKLFFGRCWFPTFHVVVFLKPLALIKYLLTSTHNIVFMQETTMIPLRKVSFDINIRRFLLFEDVMNYFIALIFFPFLTGQVPPIPGHVPEGIHQSGSLQELDGILHQVSEMTR